MNVKTNLQKLKEQRAKLEARIRMAEAREKTKEGKNNTRRKILIGAYYLDKATKENTMNEIAKLMDKYLTRDKDRELFDLSPKQENKKK